MTLRAAKKEAGVERAPRRERGEVFGNLLGNSLGGDARWTARGGEHETSSTADQRSENDVRVSDDDARQRNR